MSDESVFWGPDFSDFFQLYWLQIFLPQVLFVAFTHLITSFIGLPPHNPSYVSNMLQALHHVEQMMRTVGGSRHHGSLTIPSLLRGEECAKHQTARETQNQA
jgi:hypothetical protein